MQCISIVIINWYRNEVQTSPENVIKKKETRGQFVFWCFYFFKQKKL